LRDIRQSAAKALGRLGPAAEDALPRLILLRKDSERDVRQAAAAAVKNIDAKALAESDPH
jgi:HEAT repeat protein